MNKHIKIVVPMSETMFNDSAILTTEAQRKFVRELFAGMIDSSKAVKIYKAT